ncbi:uncharacterized protein C18orf63-like isoform X2 [Melanotaenia boesemani]|uniref:uncharacterized protein C18orf63-like isoform X2 n=1 Tax=Melanotaenia boesemani TaxID=1250792 RepID=UPI001C03FDB6|nr:uncharacterized protein C18orf63-like isoform X2 [Melanotaenia boesemani]
MSGGVQKSLFFLSLPDLKKLVCVTLTLQEEEDEELRSKQMKTCRELVLLYSDILACPGLDSFSDITAVMAIPFFHRGIIQAFTQRNRLQLASPQSVFPGDLQRCLSYSLITRLSPSWNKAGLYLIAGKHFLTERGRLNAVSMELSTSEGQLCFSIEANTVRLPPTSLEDFELSPLVLRKFCSDPECVLDPSSTGGAIWCHVLPSMKKGQIITISRRLPRDGPFQTYRDLQNHWNRLYGYRLPELAEEEVVYCSIYFRPVGERLFTYPLSCIRLQPLQRFPRVDLQGALDSFLSDIRDKLQSVCSFPARLTSRPCYRTVSLNTAASVQPVWTSFGLQLPASAPPCQQHRVQDLQENGCGFGKELTQNQAHKEDGVWSSSSSSLSSVSSSHVSLSDSSGYRSDLSFSQSSSSLQHFQPASSLSSSSSSSFLPFFQPASSLTSSFSPSVIPPPSQSQVNSTPTLLPIFGNKNPSRHVNVALLKAQKQKEQLGGGGEKRGRVTLPTFVRKTLINASSPFPTSSSASLPRPPPVVPRFSRRPKLHGSMAQKPSAHPKVTHISSLSPASKLKPAIILTPKPEIKPRTKSSIKRSSSTGSAVTNSKDETEETKQPAAPADITNKNPSSSKKKVVFKLNSKKPRTAVEDVDVEDVARSNQLSKLNSATLLQWLKQRGIPVTAKLRKEELMMKVMSRLAEA